MFDKSVLVRLFIISQSLVLIAIGFSAYLAYRRKKEAEEALQNHELNAALYTPVRRTGVPPQAQEVPKSAANSTDKKAPPLRIESAMPTWDDKTPAFEVLGVAANASAQEVESAYKVLLKKYHPDRVAHWGKGYQTRAHYLVILLQKAREKMLKPKF